jgi:hypothetical protein
MLPTCPNLQDGALATEKYFRGAAVEITEAWLKESGVVSDELCHPPKPLDESCRAYCPRCEAQFTTVGQVCTDCGGIELVTLPHQK